MALCALIDNIKLMELCLGKKRSLSLKMRLPIRRKCPCLIVIHLKFSKQSTFLLSQSRVHCLHLSKWDCPFQVFSALAWRGQYIDESNDGSSQSLRPTSFSLSSHTFLAFSASLASWDIWFSNDANALFQLQQTPDLVSVGPPTQVSIIYCSVRYMISWQREATIHVYAVIKTCASLLPASSSETKPLVMYFWKGGNKRRKRGGCSRKRPVVAMQPG